MADSSPLLTVPVEVWDRILFWMSLSPLDVANFAKSSRHCHFLAFGPVGDRNEYNVLQHGALIGPRIADSRDDTGESSFTYLKSEDGSEMLDRVLLALLRMADRNVAVRCFETLMCGLPDVRPVCFDGETLFTEIENWVLGPRTWKLLRQVAEEFEPADFGKRGEIIAFAAASGVVYGDGPQHEGVKAVAAMFAAIGGQYELLKRLLEDGVELIPKMIYHVVLRDHFDCFEVLIDHAAAEGVSSITTTCILENTHFGLGGKEKAVAHPYHLRLFQEVSKKTLPLSSKNSRLVMDGRTFRKMILRDEHPEVLVRMCVASKELSRLSRLSFSFLDRRSSAESLEIIGMMVDAGGGRFSFSLLSTAVDAAAVGGRFDIATKLVMKASLFSMPETMQILKCYYPGWYANRILLPLCVARDWGTLRREVEDFAEEAEEMSLAGCFRKLTELTNTARDVVGEDCGLVAVREIVAAFTPWLFGGE